MAEGQNRYESSGYQKCDTGIYMKIPNLMTRLQVHKAWFITRIGAKNKAVIERAGKYKGVKGAGFKIFLPFFDKVTIYDAQSVDANFIFENVYTDGRIDLTVAVDVNVKIGNYRRFHVEHRDPVKQFANRLASYVRNKFADISLQNSLSSAMGAFTELEQGEIRSCAEEFGLEITDAVIKERVQPESLEKAAEREKIAEREAKATRIDADAKRYSKEQEAAGIDAYVRIMKEQGMSNEQIVALMQQLQNTESAKALAGGNTQTIVNTSLGGQQGQGITPVFNVGARGATEASAPESRANLDDSPRSR